MPWIKLQLSLFQDAFDNNPLRFESNMTPAQLWMYGLNHYHLYQDVLEGETLSYEIEYHSPPPREEYAGEEREDNWSSRNAMPPV